MSHVKIWSVYHQIWYNKKKCKNRKESNMSIFDKLSKPNISINKSTDTHLYQLMHQDIPLIDINEETGEINIHADSHSYLPYALRKNNLTFENIKAWAERRVLLLDRQNSKNLLNACHLPQDDKYRISRICRFLSVDDCFWLRENESEKWENFDLRKNSLSNALYQIAMDGKNVSLSGDIFTPEFTNLGTFAKCWKREDDGLYLYKKSNFNYESEKEVFVSNMLDILNIDHVIYEIVEPGNVCKCRCMTNDDYSRLPFGEYSIYCRNNNIDPVQIIYQSYKEDFYKMAIVDFITANTDRHGSNWGFWIDNKAGNICGLHPLYDHNLSFGMIIPDNYSYPGLSGVTVKEIALEGEKELQINLKPLENISMENCENIGIDYKSFSKRIEFLSEQDMIHERFKSINHKMYIPHSEASENQICKADTVIENR